MVDTKDFIDEEGKRLDMILKKQGKMCCVSCAHWFGEEDTCKAFPDPKWIPREIWINHKIHDKVIPGQVGDYVFAVANQG